MTAPAGAHQPRWSEVTAIFGGTFDPPHIGHREALNGLFKEEPRIGRTLIVPAASPPHKPTTASADDRVAMVRLAFAPAKLSGPSQINLLEIDRARSHPERPSFSFDTITELRRESPELAFVVGADQLAAMATGKDSPGWHRFPELLGQCHWIVLARQPDGGRLIAETLRNWAASGLARPVGLGGSTGADALTTNTWALPGGMFLRVAPTKARALSSTAIREEISRSGRAPPGSLDPEVEAHLMRCRGYGMTDANGRNY